MRFAGRVRLFSLWMLGALMALTLAGWFTVASPDASASPQGASAPVTVKPKPKGSGSKPVITTAPPRRPAPTTTPPTTAAPTTVAPTSVLVDGNNPSSSAPSSTTGTAGLPGQDASSAPAALANSNRTGRFVTAVIFGLLFVAVALIALTYIYWRHTAPATRAEEPPGPPADAEADVDLEGSDRVAEPAQHDSREGWHPPEPAVGPGPSAPGNWWPSPPVRGPR